MELPFLTLEYLGFLALVAVGSAIQTITGFAMGLIIMAGVTLFGLADIATTAAVVSIISIVNVVTAVRRTFRFAEVRFLVALIAGMLPMVVAGVWLLSYWSVHNYLLLKTLLGLFIVTAGLSLMLKPTLYTAPSKGVSIMFAGSLAGLMAGLYGAGGAPLAYLMYRQPLIIQTVRATLLCTFAISTLFRTAYIGYEGHLTEEVLLLAAAAIPVVVIATLSGGRLAPYFSELIVRRVAFVLLVLMGGSLFLSGIFSGVM